MKIKYFLPLFLMVMVLSSITSAAAANNGTPETISITAKVGDIIHTEIHTPTDFGVVVEFTPLWYAPCIETFDRYQMRDTTGYLTVWELKAVQTGETSMLYYHNGECKKIYNIKVIK